MMMQQFYWKESNTDVATSTKLKDRVKKGNDVHCHINPRKVCEPTAGSQHSLPYWKASID